MAESIKILEESEEKYVEIVLMCEENRETERVPTQSVLNELLIPWEVKVDKCRVERFRE